MSNKIAKTDRIFIAGHRGMVGSAVLKKLEASSYKNLIYKTHSELDLCIQQDVTKFFAKQRPDVVILAAAKVGGILANSTYAADFISINSSIALNIIQAAHRYGTKKLLNLGSSCIYPKFAPQPLKEEYLLTGALEPSNEAYALAKILAIRLCKHYNEQYSSNFISLMPCNLYGINDNFDLETAHFLPAIIRKVYEAQQNNLDYIDLWGDGSPRRELLFASDLAEAIIFILENYDAKQLGEFINIGSGRDHSIAEIAKQVSSIMGFTGTIRWDKTKPNGTARKLMDSSRINTLGWRAQTDLSAGIQKVYNFYKHNN